MPDPTPFLSTIAAVSATLVAIIGGLLVARFVSLDSEQQGAQQLLDQAIGRLATAEARADEARQRWRGWETDDFFGTEVLEAVIGGERNVGELRRIGGYTPLTDDELNKTVQLVANEFFKAQETLQGLRVGDTDAPGGDWDEFRRQCAEPLDISWDAVWEIAYNRLVASAKARQAPRSFTDPLEYMRPYGTGLTGAEQAQYNVLHLQRRDGLVAAFERTRQHVEDLQAEVDQLEAARDAVVKPKGLTGGLAVLSAFTVVGVIVPLWVMSRAPKKLTAGLGEVVFWLFFTGLILLLTYMTVLAQRLSSRGRAALAAVDAFLPKWVHKLLRRPETAEILAANGAGPPPAEVAADSRPQGTETEEPK